MMWRKRQTSDKLATNVHHNEQKPSDLVNILNKLHDENVRLGLYEGVYDLSIKSDDLSIKREKAMREVQRLGQEIEQSKGIEMKQAIKLAIEWIEKQPEETPHSKYDVDTRYAVLRELEAALAQPEQREPTKQEHNILMGALKRSGKVVAQPEQEPVVTDAMVEAAVKAFWGYENSKVCRTAYRLAIKAALQEKFCDNNCVWTDHHPDCKLAQPEQCEYPRCACDNKESCKQKAQPEQWGVSAVTHPEYVAEQKRKTEELRSMVSQPEQKPATYSAWGLMGGDEFVKKDSLNRNIT